MNSLPFEFRVQVRGTPAEIIDLNYVTTSLCACMYMLFMHSTPWFRGGACTYRDYTLTQCFLQRENRGLPLTCSPELDDDTIKNFDTFIHEYGYNIFWHDIVRFEPDIIENRAGRQRRGEPSCSTLYELVWPARLTLPLLFIMPRLICQGEGSSNSTELL